jgi:ribosomal protein L9
MKLILKEDISKLGRKGDIVNVAKGYGSKLLNTKKYGDGSYNKKRNNS